jgi:hypothetical protein
MIIHIDMSQKFSNVTTIGIAWASSDKQEHKGLALDGKIIKRLVQEYHADRDFARLYAICIFLLTEQDIERIEKMIICNDEPFFMVKRYLDMLFEKFPCYPQIQVENITKYREEVGKRKLKSSADKFANSYRKRGLKPTQWYKGRQLRGLPVNYITIVALWIMLEKKKRGVAYPTS